MRVRDFRLAFDTDFALSRPRDFYLSHFAENFSQPTPHNPEQSTK